MRILLLTADAQGGFGLIPFFERAFEALGHEAKVLVLRPPGRLQRLARLGGPSLASLAQRGSLRAWRMVYGLGAGRAASLVKQAIDDFAPDVALTVAGGLPRDVPECCAHRGVPLYNYFPDPPPHHDQTFIESVPLYAGFFTFARDYIPAWYLYGARTVQRVPFACDPLVHVPKAPPAGERNDYYSPVAYLATWQPHAEFWPERLLPFGLKIWGNQWYKLPADHRVRTAWQGEARGTLDQLTFVCGAADITFNIVRAFNGQSHSMKTFEIPACRGFMLTNRSDEQLEFFPEDEGAVYFSTEQELADKVRFYLANESARERIVARGHEIAKQHPYVDRARDMIAHFQAAR